MWRAIFSSTLQQTLYSIFIFIKIIFLLFYFNFFFSLLISLFFFVSPLYWPTPPSKTQQQPPLHQVANSKPNIQNQQKSKSKPKSTTSVTYSTIQNPKPTTTPRSANLRPTTTPKSANPRPTTRPRSASPSLRDMEKRGERGEQRRKKKKT